MRVNRTPFTLVPDKLAFDTEMGPLISELMDVIWQLRRRTGGDDSVFQGSVRQSDDNPNWWNGSHREKTNVCTAGATLDDTYHILIATGAAAQNFNLPAISATLGSVVYWVNKSATGTSTLVRNGTDTINGAASNYVITGRVGIVADVDNADWHIFSGS